MESKTTNKHSLKGIEKSNIRLTINSVDNWPIIANHLILIRLANKTVFTYIISSNIQVCNF